MKKIVMLRPAQPVEQCYLFEVLYWRAFGRLPEEEWIFNEPWRTSDEVRDSPDAPTPGGSELTDDECEFAGIPPDPQMQSLIDGIGYLEPDKYQSFLDMLRDDDPRDFERENVLIKEMESAKRFSQEVEEWLPHFNEYIDQFKSEIALDLRRGRLTALATELPKTTYEASEEDLEKQGIWLDDLPVAAVPATAWISDAIKWEVSAIYGRTRAFIWINLNMSEVLELYPPVTFINESKAYPIGSSVALIGSNMAYKSTSKRGRPALPWDLFHIEVARLYAMQQMPAKKEAAIALLQEWFARQFNKEVSRSAIGAKLKPYFDTIGTNS